MKIADQQARRRYEEIHRGQRGAVTLDALRSVLVVGGAVWAVCFLTFWWYGT